MAAFARSVEVQRTLGVLDCRVLERDELGAVVPDLRTDDLAGGLFGPSDGYIDGHAYCNALAAAVSDRGGRVLQGTELIGCDPLPGDRNRLRTNRGDLECDIVVNAAGGWAGRVGDILGAPVTILPQRHQALIAHLPEPLGYVMPSVMDYVPSSGGFGAYFRDDGPGRLVAGLHTEEVIHDIVDPDAVQRDTAGEYVELVAERLAHRLPRLEDMRLGDVWAGIYPMRPDGRPVVGPSRRTGVGGDRCRCRRLGAPVVTRARAHRRGLDRRRARGVDSGRCRAQAAGRRGRPLTGGAAARSSGDHRPSRPP